ncbi:MAG: sugar transferase [Acidimicrobiia bacterium]|nr:sugar transferase [Acidimicrobiia bacterium]
MGKAAVSGFWPSVRRHDPRASLVVAPVDAPTKLSRSARAIEDVHASAPRLGVFVLDGLIVLAACLLAGATAAAAVAAVAAFLAVGRLTNLYSDRSLDAQGLSWYLRLLPYPLLAVATALVVAGHHGTSLLGPVLGVGLALTAVRAAAWFSVSARRRRREGLTGALLVGDPSRTHNIARRIKAFPEAGLQVAATFAPTNTNGERSRARGLLKSGAVSHILVAADAHDEALIAECLSWTDGRPVEVHLVLPVGVQPSHGSRIGDLSVLTLRRANASRMFWGKRLIDILGSALLLLFLAPVLMLVSLAILLYDGRPVIYRQKRVGRDNREFTIWKFRSMVVGADKLNEQYASDNVANGLLFKLPGDPRVTPVGSMIRRLSLDELPQLVNVLKGDMSLVGPRPLPVDPEDFDEIASRRHRVKPGITGPWQVAGGHTVAYDDMIKLDLAYVDTWSVRKDLWYLAMTIPTVLVRRSSAY